MARLRDRTNPNRKFEELRLAAANARLPFDKDAYLNLAFYLDYQYTEWIAESNSIQEIPKPDAYRNAPRPVVNKIMHLVNQQHAFVLQPKPTVDVLPATDDPLDASQAAVSLAYLRWLTEPQVGDFDSVVSEAAMWALICGEGFIKWVYNPRLKRPDFLAPSYFDIYVDPYAKSFKNARYVIHSQFMDVEQVNDIYDKEVSASSVMKVDEFKSTLLRDMGHAPVLQGVQVHELWMKPCKRYPEGLFTVWTGRESLVPPSKFPYAHGQLPFTQLGSIPRPGTFHYHSVVKYLRAPQMELNKYHAQRIAIRESFNPKWWVPEELEFEGDIDNSPNQVIRGSGANGLRPEVIQPGTMPDNQDGAWITEEMMHVVGMHEVSQAQVPGRVEAAKAIEMLRESDASRSTELTRTIKQAVSDGFWQELMLAKQYVSEEQIIQTYSREGIPEVKRFKASKIQPGTRVNVTMGTGLARSRAARQDQLMVMWQNQIIQDPEVMAELLEVPVPTFISQKAADIRLARNENYDMAKDVAITPNSWDDHEIHLREINNFRKTQEFLTLPTKVKQKFEYHAQKHEEFQMQQLKKLVQKQALMAGAGQEQQPGTGAQTPPGDTPGPAQSPATSAPGDAASKPQQ